METSKTIISKHNISVPVKAVLSAALALALTVPAVTAPSSFAATKSTTITWVEGQSMPTPKQSITVDGVKYNLVSVSDPVISKQGENTYQMFSETRKKNIAPDSKSMAPNAVPESLQINSDGYTGTIPRVDLIVNEITETVDIPITTTRTMFMDSEDYKAIPETTEEQGVTCKVTDAYFTPVENGFQATAEYKGVKQEKKITGYTVIGSYQGQLSKVASKNEYKAEAKYESVNTHKQNTTQTNPNAGKVTSIPLNNNKPSNPAYSIPTPSTPQANNTISRDQQIQSSQPQPQNHNNQQQQNQSTQVITPNTPGAQGLNPNDTSVSGPGVLASGIFSELSQMMPGQGSNSSMESSNTSMTAGNNVDPFLSNQQNNGQQAQEQPITTELKDEKNKANTNTNSSLPIIPIVAGGTGIVALTGLVAFMIFKRRKNKDKESIENINNDSTISNSPVPLAELGLTNTDSVDKTQLLDNNANIVYDDYGNQVAMVVPDTINEIGEQEPVLYMGEMIAVDIANPDNQQTLATLTIKPSLENDETGNPTHVIIPEPPIAFIPENDKDYYIVLNTIEGLNHNGLQVFLGTDDPDAYMLIHDTQGELTDQIMLDRTTLTEALSFLRKDNNPIVNNVTGDETVVMLPEQQYNNFEDDLDLD